MPQKLSEITARPAAQRPSSLEVAGALELVRQTTAQVFSKPFECIEKEDCETGDRYFEFRVADDGEVGEIFARDAQWHRRIAALPTNLIGLFRLAIDAQE